MANNKPEIFGPGAGLVKIEAIPDATGHPGEPEVEKPAGPAEQQVVDQAQAEQQQEEVDPAFPFGKPDKIDYKELDIAGHELITELNLRPWIKTVEYCSGHPLDRFPEEKSDLYPYGTGENVYEEMQKLDMAFMRGLINDTYFKYRKKELREVGATRFYLNVNVYDEKIFKEWIKLASSLVIATTHNGLYPLKVQFNPLRFGTNYSIYWDYWTMEEREMVHVILLTALQNFPV